MRSLLSLAVLMALCASANAATVNHARHHLVAGSSEAFLGYAVPHAAAGPTVRYNDTPSYDDPSKFGGEAPLPVAD